MINPRQRNVIRKRVHTRIREKMSGTAERPRLNVYRSLNHIYTSSSTTERSHHRLRLLEGQEG